MRIATWNLDHRAGNGRTHDAAQLAGAIHELAADVVVLTEYVPRKSRGLPTELAKAGYSHQAQSDDHGSGNNVLIASRGELAAHSDFDLLEDQDARTNVLHVRHAESGIQIFGVRVPAYKRGTPGRAEMWQWLTTTVSPTLRDRRSVMIGDLNVDPAARSRDRAYAERFRTLAEGWQHAAPPDGASYWSVTRAGATKPTCLDHALVSPRLSIRDAAYVTRTASHALVHPPAPRDRRAALSDHAALLVDVTARETAPLS